MSYDQHHDVAEMIDVLTENGFSVQAFTADVDCREQSVIFEDLVVTKVE